MPCCKGEAFLFLLYSASMSGQVAWKAEPQTAALLWAAALPTGLPRVQVLTSIAPAVVGLRDLLLISSNQSSYSPGHLLLWPPEDPDCF